MLFDTTERNVNMGLPISYLKRPKKINSLWGQEYIALRRKELNEEDMERISEAMIKLRKIEKEKKSIS